MRLRRIFKRLFDAGKNAGVIGRHRAGLRPITHPRPSHAVDVLSAYLVTATLFTTALLRECLPRNRDHPYGVREDA
jgi:hypothetical protein